MLKGTKNRLNYETKISLNFKPQLENFLIQLLQHTLENLLLSNMEMDVRTQLLI
jgi:hypothetical protein